MEQKPTVTSQWPPAQAVDTFIRLILLGGLLLWCVLILTPFTSILLWAVILAVALYPFFAMVARWLGGRRGWAATVLVLLGLAFVMVPTYFTGSSLVGSIQTLRSHVGVDDIQVPQLPADWYEGKGLRKMIADRWPESNGAVATMLKDNADTVRGLVTASLVALGAFTVDMLKFVLSIIVAGVLLANAKAGGQAAERFLERVMGPRGPAMVALAEGTIRNVAKGILGVAVIQTLMFAAGVFIAGVPGAGLLAVVALLLCVVQIGVGPVAIGVIIYAFAAMDTTTAVILTVWLVITMVSDNVLKPLLLGRGAAVPTAVIFLGAIGGFLLSGFIGLFTGAVVLSIGYQLMNAWMGSGEKQPVEAAGG